MLRRVDPLGPVFALLGLAVFLLHGLNGPLTRDLALYAYSGQQFADGVVPYVSVMNRAGPLAHIVPGIGATIAGWLGADDISTQRILSTLVATATVWLVYVLGRDLHRSRSAGAIAAASLLTIKVFILFATGGSREKTTMMLLVTLALWAVLHRRWGWAGVFVSLATLTWQPAFSVAAATALAAMAALRGRALARALLRFCLGGAIPAVAALLGFALAGALRPLLDGFLLVNLRYTEQIGLIKFLHAKNGDYLDEGFGASLVVLVLGLVAVLVNAVLLWLRSEDRDEPAERTQIAMAFGVLAALVTSLKTVNGWPDLLFVVPISVLAFAGVVQWLVARAPRPTIVAAGLCALAVVLAGWSATATRGNVLVAQRAAVHSIFRIAGADATLASIGAPAPLVLEHKTNPVRYQMFTHGFDQYVDDTYPGGLQGLAHHLDRLRPTFMTVDSGARYRWIKPTIRRHYVFVGAMGDVDWFARKDLAGEEIQRLNAVLDVYARTTHG